MISRRGAFKIAATSVLPAVLSGCGSDEPPAEPTVTSVPTEVPPAIGTPLSSQTIDEAPSHISDQAVRTFHGDISRTGAMPGPAPRLDLPIIVKWKYDLKGDGTTPPVVVDDLAYITIRRDIVALSTATGEEVWRFETTSDVFCTPSVASGVLYVGSNDEHLYAIDARSGKGIWKAHLGDAIHGSPAVVDGAVYATIIGNGRIVEEHSSRGAEGRLFSLDARTGKELWRFSMTGLSYSAPAVSGNELFVTCTEGFVYAVSATDGTELWRYQTGSSTRNVPSAVVANGLIYVSLGESSLVALDTATGNEVWRFRMGDALRSMPTNRNGVLYFSSGNGMTYAVNSRSGIEQWQKSWENNFYTNYSASILDDMMYLGIGAFHASSGEWLDGYEYESVSEITSSSKCAQSVVDGVIYVVTSEFLLAIGNLLPTLIADATVLRGAPSPSGVSYGNVYIGNEVTEILSTEEVNGEWWAQVIVKDVTGWIPLETIESATLPPKGAIEYVYVPPVGMYPTPAPTPKPTPTPIPTPTPLPVYDFVDGDMVTTRASTTLRARPMDSGYTLATLPEGVDMEILKGPVNGSGKDWYQVTVLEDATRGYVVGIDLRYTDDVP